MLQNADIFSTCKDQKRIEVKFVDMEMGKLNFRGDRVESLRKELGWTLSDLANEASKTLGRSIGEAQLSLIENGKRLPSLQLAVALSRALQASLDYLCNISEYDRTSAGDDEVVVVVSGDSERQRIQRLAYRFLELETQDQDRIFDLVDRFGNTSSLTNQERFSRALADLASLAGTEAADKFRARFS